MRRTIAALAAALLLPTAARAQPLGWSVTPGGEAIHTAEITTTGFFGCGASPLMVGASCVASGNSITLGNNGAFLTLTFTGLTQTVTASNVRRPFAVGVISQTLTGAGPFLFPATRQPFPNLDDPTFTFRVTLAGIGTRPYGFNVAAPSATVGANCCQVYPTYFWYGGQSPAPFRYSGVVADSFTNIQLRADGSPLEITAAVGIVPEPATLVLAGLGTLLTAAAARRSRR